MRGGQEKFKPIFDQDAFKRDLEWVLCEDGVPFARLGRYWEAESRFVHDFSIKQGGSLRLTRAAQSLFLESVVHCNLASPSIPKETELTFYTRFVPKVLSCFHQLFSAELMATHGYPLQAFSQLRNIFDHLLLIAAVMHGLTDFFKLEGYKINRPYEMDVAKKLRLLEERKVREQLVGKKSGLSQQTLDDLKLWNDLFDREVHGSNFSLGGAMNWVQGNGSLAVHPSYTELPSTMYANRVVEIAWMAHRLLPLLQHSAMSFPEEWAEKWRLVDHWFAEFVRCLTAQQKIKFGAAIAELVQNKLPFSEHSRYPLEGLKMPELVQLGDDATNQ